jgi:hypothetical protein
MPDRYGELVDEDQADLADVVQLPHRCANGWLDRNADNPVPCPTCRPHLAERLTHLRARQAERRRERTELDTARTAAIPHRHQARLAHLTEHQPTTDDQP